MKNNKIFLKTIDDYTPTKEKSKQNIIRDMEIKNNVTIAREEWGWDSGERSLQKLLYRTQGQNQGGV